MPDSTVPRPGGPVRGSTTGRPVMAVLDLLGRRWILRVVWELRQQPAGFRELRRRCDSMSSSVLAARLRELREARLVSVDPGGIYHLTPLGERLHGALAPLQDWASAWAEELQSDSQP
jgi:DNA-binding HxlR family transcriptional regulator